MITSARRTGPSLRTEIWQFYNRKRALKSNILWHREWRRDRNRQRGGPTGLKEIVNKDSASADVRKMERMRSLVFLGLKVWGFGGHHKYRT